MSYQSEKSALKLIETMNEYVGVLGEKNRANDERIKIQEEKINLLTKLNNEKSSQ